MRMAVFASGNGSNFEKIAKTKYRKSQVCLLITDNEQAYCIERSRKLAIPYMVFPYDRYGNKTNFENGILQVLKEYRIDCIILAGYMRIIGDTLLNAYPERIINIHPALLPSFKGRNGIKDAYEYGVKIMGITIHYVTKDVDGGKIIAQDCFFVGNKSLDEAEKEIHRLEHRLYPQVIKKLFDR